LSNSGRRALVSLPLAFVIAALALAGCASGPEYIDPKAPYPTLGQSRQNRDLRSTLVVYTATWTDWNVSDDSGAKIRHSGYTIYNEHGEYYDYIRNYIGVSDTEPTTIELDPGRYIIKLDNPEKQAPVFRVVIQQGKLTTVSLPR
jgi:hypothetical protein